MTIVFLVRLFYPHIGGVEKHVLEVGRILIKKGHKVIVITETPLLDQKLTTTESLPTKIEGIEIFRIPVGKNERFKKFAIWKYLFIHKNIIKNADIVHCHDVFFWYLPFKFMFPGKRVFTTFHGFETEMPISKKAIFMHKIGEKLSSGNICVGDFLKKWYGTKPNFITYGGTQISKSLNSKKNNLLNILFVGRLSKDTGIEIYEKTLGFLLEKNIKFTFVACGDGVFKNSLEKYGKVVGFVDDLAEYFKNADIVFSSSYLSILESLGYKKNVFAVYGNTLKKDYLEMSPFRNLITIKDNYTDLAKEICEYLDKENTKFKRMRENGYAFAKKETWEKVTSLYLSLWNR